MEKIFIVPTEELCEAIFNESHDWCDDGFNLARDMVQYLKNVSVDGKSPLDKAFFDTLRAQNAVYGEPVENEGYLHYVDHLPREAVRATIYYGLNEATMRLFTGEAEWEVLLEWLMAGDDRQQTLATGWLNTTWPKLPANKKTKLNRLAMKLYQKPAIAVKAPSDIFGGMSPADYNGRVLYEEMFFHGHVAATCFFDLPTFRNDSIELRGLLNDYLTYWTEKEYCRPQLLWQILSKSEITSRLYSDVLLTRLKTTEVEKAARYGIETTSQRIGHYYLLTKETESILGILGTYEDFNIEGVFGDVLAKAFCRWDVIMPEDVVVGQRIPAITELPEGIISTMTFTAQQIGDAMKNTTTLQLSDVLTDNTVISRALSEDSACIILNADVEFFVGFEYARKVMVDLLGKYSQVRTWLLTNCHYGNLNMVLRGETIVVTPMEQLAVSYERRHQTLRGTNLKLDPYASKFTPNSTK